MKNKLWSIFFSLFYSSMCYAATSQAIVLYGSDRPEELLSFSISFTNKLNELQIFKALHERSLNSLWLKNISFEAPKKNIVDKIVSMTEELKSLYLNKDYQKLILVNKEYEANFIEIIRHEKIKKNTKFLTNFFFWSAAAEIQDGLKTKNNLYMYQQEASLIEKSLLEAQVDPKIVKFFQTPIQTPNNISPVLLEQRNLQGEAASSPSSTFPSVDTLKNAKFNWTLYPNLILIFWSKNSGDLEVKWLDTSSFKERKTVHLELNSNAQFNQVEEKLILFFQKAKD